MPRPNNAKGSSNRKGKSTGKPFGKKDDSSRSDFKKSNPKKSFSKKSDSGTTPRSAAGARPFRKGSSSGDSFKPRPSRFKSDESGDRPFRKKSEGGSKFGDSKSSERPFRKKSDGDAKSGSRFGDGKSSERPFRKKTTGDAKSSSRFGDNKSSDRPFRKKTTGDFKSGSKFKSERSTDRSSDRPFKKKSEGGFKSTPGKFRADGPSDRPYKKPSDKPFRSDLTKTRFGSKGGARSNEFKDDEGSEKATRKKHSEESDIDSEVLNTGANLSPETEDTKPEGKRSIRKDSQRSNPNYGLPFKRKQGDSVDPEKPTRRIRSEASFKPGTPSKRGFKKFESNEDGPKDPRIRLNKFISNSGVCSRREADDLITMGLISVNGKTITELGYKVNPGDEVRHESKVLRAEKPVYILLNKPKGYLTTTTDPQERNTVMDIIGNAVKERIYPVGRLDRNTTGLLLFTNDGDLAERLMHPSYNVKKIYKVELDKPLTRGDYEKIKEGVLLEEGRAMVDDVAIVSDDNRTVGLEIHIGWNRVVRRIFEALEYTVLKLDRSVYAGLDKKDLPRGHWRYLSKDEVLRLKHFK
jgi:23S rRNA pseudouridine2605 synthase